MFLLVLELAIDEGELLPEPFDKLFRDIVKDRGKAGSVKDAFLLVNPVFQECPDRIPGLMPLGLVFIKL